MSESGIRYRYECDACGGFDILRAPMEDKPCKEYPPDPRNACHGTMRVVRVFDVFGADTSGTVVNPTVALHEEHRWEEYGQRNPHLLPPKGSEVRARWEKEGRIVKDPRTGRPTVLCKNKADYIRCLNESGQTNAYREGRA